VSAGQSCLREPARGAAQAVRHGVQEIAEWMTDAAPRIPLEVVTGQATVLQLFEMANKRTDDVVAGCRVTEGTLRTGAPAARPH